MNETYPKLCAHARRTGTLGSIHALVNWDQETYMPQKAAPFRAEESALLAELHHERATSAEFGELISACEQDRGLMADPRRAANVRELRRDYDLATKLPSDLVAELARTGSKAQQVWKEARQKSDFAMFAPWLEKMTALARRKAECYGTPKGGEPYDALLNEYEPGATAREIEAIFTPLGEKLAALLKDLGAGKGPDEAPKQINAPEADQHNLGEYVLGAMGFDLEAGRLDVTTHPFCEGMAPGDTRLTTRYREEKFTDALYGTMHEGGHGIYEQGIPKDATDGDIELYGTPLTQAISLGIHESQSRMWENFVGRSLEFWNWLHPKASELLPELKKFSPEQIYRSVNTAAPSYIRVEADEATYNLHIMLRFEIERGLFNGQLQPKDVPGAWNETFKKYLGIEVPDDRRGCLQDVHWSFGLMGYFPTYCLGNLYCAQFWETINGAIPDLAGQMARGEFGQLRKWLNENIHACGRQYRAGELCEKLTGKALIAEPLLRHLERKLRPIYGV
ncbi:MAG: carboxypeptidase M32 [Phycisphaerales bacterium JB039]